MKLKKHAPSVKYHTRSTITEMATINRVKIITMGIYHNTPNIVNSIYEIFTILLSSPVKVFYLTPKTPTKL